MGMTKTENSEAKCYFCQGAATAIKQEVELVEGPDGADGPDAEAIELLPICADCHEDNYDGTERYPALLPLN